jgi:LruC domain-containing protein
MRCYFKIIIGCAVILSSCQKEVTQLSTGQINDASASEFDFSTSKNVTVNVNYGTKTAIPFSIYAENPVTLSTGEDSVPVANINTSIKPLFTSYTNTDGTFSTSIELPCYTNKLYVYSPAFYVQSLMEATISNGSATATESTSSRSAVATRANTTGTSTNKMTLRGNQNKVKNWETPLGTFNSYTGMIDYASTNDGSSLYFTDAEVANYYSDIPNVLNVGKECPPEYLTSQDIVVPKNEKISITMLGGNTCWNSTLAYYYYTGDAPTSDPAHIFVLFPNTQDGQWKPVGGKGDELASPTGLNRGTAAILKYYGANYNEAASETFPQGTKIGFVLACNSWGVNTGNRDFQYKTQNFFSYSTPNLSSENYYKVNNVSERSAYYKVNTAMMNYQDGTIVAFEDHNNDHNCSDVLFALKPQFGIQDNLNTIKEIVTTSSETVSNVYCFEDLWPTIGDYDMNDVIVYATYANTLEANAAKNDNNHYITQENYIFKTDQNHSNRTSLNNGLAAWINGTGLGYEVSVKSSSASDYTTLEASKYSVEEENGKTYFYLDANVKNDMGATYKITVKHSYDDKLRAVTTYGCFLYRDDSGKGRWEVHIPNESPTSKLSDYYRNFITTKPYAALMKDDNVFYPFAIKLTGATESNITKLLDAGNETKRIDALYSGYKTWFTSGGADNTDWYIAQ